MAVSNLHSVEFDCECRGYRTGPRIFLCGYPASTFEIGEIAAPSLVEIGAQHNAIGK